MLSERSLERKTCHTKQGKPSDIKITHECNVNKKTDLPNLHNKTRCTLHFVVRTKLRKRQPLHVNHFMVVSIHEVKTMCFCMPPSHTHFAERSCGFNTDTHVLCTGHKEATKENTSFGQDKDSVQKHKRSETPPLIFWRGQRTSKLVS